MSTTLSCGQCGAPLRAEQDWCSLCHASVAASFDPLTAPLDEVVGRAEAPEPAAPDPVVASATAEAVPDVRLDRTNDTRPMFELDESSDPVGDQPAAEITDLDVMFSMLAAEHRRSDPTSGIAARLQDRSTRIAVIVGGMALIGAVGFLVLTVLGAIF